MKNLLTTFAGASLSREQMRKIKGGMLCICSTGGPSTPDYPPSGTCGGPMNNSEAIALAAELNASGDGYTYVAGPC